MSKAKDHNSTHIEEGSDASHNPHASEPFESQTAIQKRLIQKVDWRLIPMLIPLYAFSLIDRTNLAGARLSGIDDDLGVDQGARYSIAILVFYAGYVIFELPSNLALKRFGGPTWLAILGLTFGVCTLGIGFARNYATLVVLRVLLGCLEAGLFPGCIYLISAWYPRYSVQKRIAVFFSVSAFISSFANILAYGLTQISEEPERHGWRWIFIIQGCITISIAFLTFFVLPDFPESKRNKFLSSDERLVLRDRLIVERGDAEAGKVTWKVVKSTMSDWYTWTTSIIYMGGSCGLYGFLFFLPVLLRRSFGFSQSASFYLCTPPAAFAVMASIAVSYLSDKYQTRGVFVIAECLVGAAGLAMVGFVQEPAPRYFGTFLGMSGTTALVSTALAWGQNNIRDDAKRSVVTVIQVLWAAIGGIYSSLVFRQQDAPNYIPGLVATFALLILNAVLAIFTMFFLRRSNQKIARGELVVENAPDFFFTL